MRVCTQMSLGDTKISMTTRASPELQGLSGVATVRPGNPHSTNRACPVFFNCFKKQFLKLLYSVQAAAISGAVTPFTAGFLILPSCNATGPP